MEPTTQPFNIQELQDQVKQLKNQVTELTDAYYRNNFSQQQIFNKYSDFTFRLKIPVVTALASTAEVGELCVYSGNLYLCYAANTWGALGFI